MIVPGPPPYERAFPFTWSLLTSYRLGCLSGSSCVCLSVALPHRYALPCLALCGIWEFRPKSLGLHGKHCGNLWKLVSHLNMSSFSSFLFYCGYTMNDFSLFSVSHRCLLFGYLFWVAHDIDDHSGALAPGSSCHIV